VRWDTEKEEINLLYEIKANPTGYRLGYTYSEDGISWKKSPMNPIFVPEDKGSWDSGKVSCPTIVRTGDNTFNTYYAGAPGSGATYQGIGLVKARLKINARNKHKMID